MTVTFGLDQEWTDRGINRLRKWSPNLYSFAGHIFYRLFIGGRVENSNKRYEKYNLNV